MNVLITRVGSPLRITPYDSVHKTAYPVFQHPSPTSKQLEVKRSTQKKLMLVSSESRHMAICARVVQSTGRGVRRHEETFNGATAAPITMPHPLKPSLRNAGARMTKLRILQCRLLMWEEAKEA
jgi:hypothetical protein